MNFSEWRRQILTSGKGPDIGGSNLASSGCPTSSPSAPLQVQSRSLAEHLVTSLSFLFSSPIYSFPRNNTGMEALAAKPQNTVPSEANTNHLSALGKRGWAGHTHDLVTRVNNPDAGIGNLHREGHPARAKRAVVFSSPSLTVTWRPQGMESGCEENPVGVQFQPMNCFGVIS